MAIPAGCCFGSGRLSGVFARLVVVLEVYCPTQWKSCKVPSAKSHVLLLPLFFFLQDLSGANHAAYHVNPASENPAEDSRSHGARCRLHIPSLLLGVDVTGALVTPPTRSGPQYLQPHDRYRVLVLRVGVGQIFFVFQDLGFEFRAVQYLGLNCG